jgi:DNA-binding NarL/FixJ family response regulator
MSVPATKSVRKARILVVDDHPLFCEGVVQLINRQDDLACCGIAGNVAETRAAMLKHKPDLVLLDLRLGNEDGLELIKGLLNQFPKSPILVVSQYDEALYAERALRAGAMGYINKQEMSEKIIDGIRQVMEGKIFLSPQMTERLLQRAVGATPQLVQSPIESLSDRELEIFKMIGKGMTTRLIATELHLSIKTVETHRENIKSKLDIPNSAELSCAAVQWVMENGV